MDVVLLYWNDLERVAQCLRQLENQVDADDCIWIVDNGSDTPFYTDEMNVTVLRTTGNAGYSGGVNSALSQILKTDSDTVLLLNTDVLLPAGFVAKLKRLGDAHTSVSLLSPALHETGKNSDRTYWGAKHIAYHLRTRRKKPKTAIPAGALYPSPFLSGTALLVRTAVFRDVGLLHEPYFFSGEIADFCARAHNKGYSAAVAPHLTITHELDSSEKHRDRIHAYYSLRNRFLFIQDHVPDLLFFVKWIWGGLAVILVFRARLMKNPSLSRSLRCALQDGWAGRFGQWSQQDRE